MARLSVFNHVSLDGYFVDADGDMSWARTNDAEWNIFAEQTVSRGGTLIFGRITHELMAGFWPTPFAAKSFPAVAERMNNLPKFVFSRVLDNVSWNNTTLLKGDLALEVRKMKAESDGNIVILGSGSLVAQLAPEGLIDELMIVVNPIVLGNGRTIFEGVREKLPLTLTRSRVFANGNLLLCYEPVS